jgi:hypothetical protein
MTKIPSAREVYGALEGKLAPELESLVRTNGFTQTVALAASLSKATSRQVSRISTRLLHTVNLPASTDIQRLRRQVGALDREIRQLRMELARANEAKRDS